VTNQPNSTQGLFCCFLIDGNKHWLNQRVCSEWETDKGRGYYSNELNEVKNYEWRISSTIVRWAGNTNPTQQDTF